MLGLPQPAPEPILTIAPPPARIMCGSTARLHQIRALQVDGHDAVEGRFVGVQHRAERADRRVVDQRIDAAVTRQRRSTTLATSAALETSASIRSACSPRSFNSARKPGNGVGAVLEICGASSPNADDGMAKRRKAQA